MVACMFRICAAAATPWAWLPDENATTPPPRAANGIDDSLLKAPRNLNDPDFVDGTLSWGVKSSDLLRSFGLARAVAGKPYYLTDESELTTWSVEVGPDGNLSDKKLFANQGGESV